MEEMTLVNFSQIIIRLSEDIGENLNQVGVLNG
jgi:hypothetical protein